MTITIQLITEDVQRRTFKERVLAQYAGWSDSQRSSRGPTVGELRAALQKIPDGAAATDEQMLEIVGNLSWRELPYCSCCGEPEQVLRITSSNMEYPLHLCRVCVENFEAAFWPVQSSSATPE